jgi:predicted DsbA family dithiol-disulfide isomerase
MTDDDQTVDGLSVEIWSDVVCPWCYIGKRRFETALERFSATHPDVEVDVRYRSFMLDPTAPVGQSSLVREVYERKFGGPDAAEEIIERVTTEASGEGLDFNLDIAKRSNTLAAHRLLVLAERSGCQNELKERLLAAYFAEGEPIGETDTLMRLAGDVGIDATEARAWLDSEQGRTEVEEHLEFAEANFMTGVPTFVFDRTTAVQGAQAPDVFLDMLERRLSAGRSHPQESPST